MIQMQYSLHLWQLRSDILDFSKEACHAMKITLAECILDMDILNTADILFQSLCSGWSR